MKRPIAITLGVLLFLGLLVAGTLAFIDYALFQPGPLQSEALIFEVRPGQGLRIVSRNLETRGLVPFGFVLETFGRYRGYAGRLQAGSYRISRSMAPAEILAKIVSGDAVVEELTVTIPEGWSLDDIERYFEELGLFSRERFQEAAVMSAAYADFEFLGAIEYDTILDGYLFPDTYRVFPDSTPESIVRRMLANFQQRVIVGLAEELAVDDRGLHEILTLASIVQAESANDEEMPLVAGVFWKRLLEWIPLESDATVNYVLGTNKRQPTFADTEVDDPYNTYENYGLPPGPIGNPGLPAIRAALAPAEHPYYFFLHPEEGGIVLSRTFAEHLANKARYLD